jgi:hypothetical protein
MSATRPAHNHPRDSICLVIACPRGAWDAAKRDAFVYSGIHREAAAPEPSDHPGILDDSIEGNVQRVDALRVLELALASQGVPEVNAPSLLRDIEEGGYTLRLTTDDERRRRREGGPT